MSETGTPLRGVPASVRFVSLHEFLPEPGAHELAFLEAIQVEFFVGRMGVVIRQADAEQEGIDAQDFLELVHDGDGAAFAHEDGFAFERLFQRAQRGLGGRAGGREMIGFAAVAGVDLDAHGGWADFFEPGADGLADVRGFLVGHEAAGDLGTGPGGHDGLAAFALVAAGEAVDLKGGAGGALFFFNSASLSGKRLFSARSNFVSGRTPS